MQFKGGDDGDDNLQRVIEIKFFELSFENHTPKVILIFL